jgi:hypothetical protein
MPAKKNILLNKLKKSLKKPTVVAVTEQSILSPDITITERRGDLVRKLRLAQDVDSARHDIRLHLSMFPDDRSFSCLLQVDSISTIQTILAHIDDTSTTLVEDMTRAWKDQMHTTDPSLQFFLDLSALPSEIVVDDLLTLDSFVFETLYFIPPELAKRLLPPLLQMLHQLPHETPRPQIRQTVKSYIFEHRYAHVISYLEQEVGDTAKQHFVQNYIRSQFQNSRAMKTFLLIAQLVEDKKQSFSPMVAQILLRNLPVTENITSLRHYLDVILNVVILRAEPRALRKYFANAAQFTTFTKTVYPQIATHWESMIQERLWTEFPQSYVFQNAHRIPWSTFLEILREPSLISLETRLYDSLYNNTQQRLDDVLRYIQTESQTKNLNTMHLNTLLERFIATKPYTQQRQLRKLLSLSVDKVHEILTKDQEGVYTTLLDTLSVMQDVVPPHLRLEEKVIPTVTTRVQRDVTELYRLRLHIPDFDHVLLRPIDTIDNYIGKEAEPGLFHPNDDFFHDMADSSVPKSQQKDVFTLRGLRMNVINVSIYNKYSIQNEDTYLAEVTFIRSQQNLDTLLHPLPFFSYFLSCPLLNHQSPFMNTLRAKMQQRLEKAVIKTVPHVNAEALSRDIEQQIYTQSHDMKTYTETVARVLTLLTLEHAQFFRSILSRLRIDTLFQLIHDDIFLLFPEAKYGVGPLTQLFERESYELFRVILLDAYLIEYPMRRVPYLPYWRQPVDVEKIEVRFDELQKDAHTVVLQKNLYDDDMYTGPPVDISVSSSSQYPSSEDITTAAPPDPLASFLDVAFRDAARLNLMTSF